MSSFPLRQLEDKGPVPGEALLPVEAFALREAAVRTQHQVILAPGMAVEHASMDDVHAELYKDLSIAVSSLVGMRGNFKTDINTFVLSPQEQPAYDWHSDGIPDMFAISSLASTVGTKGRLDTPDLQAAESRVKAWVLPGREKGLPGVELQYFPAGHAIRITRGAIHTPPLAWMTEHAARPVTNIKFITLF